MMAQPRERQRQQHAVAPGAGVADVQVVPPRLHLSAQRGAADQRERSSFGQRQTLAGPCPVLMASARPLLEAQAVQAAGAQAWVKKLQAGGRPRPAAPAALSLTGKSGSPMEAAKA